MKKFVVIFPFVCLLGLTLVPDFAKSPANPPLSVGLVKADKANVYSLPAANSPILTVLKRGEEFPIMSSSAGDAMDPIIHKVKKGETLWIISNRYGISVSELQKENQLTTKNLNVGQTLKIPGKTLNYKVKRGDTIGEIASRLKVSANELMKFNHLYSTKLHTGQRLKIPDYYVQIQWLGGKKGWIKKSLLQSRNIKQVMMGWNDRGTTKSYIQQNKKTNVNVVSPRWFTLSSTGNFVTDSGDPRFVRESHAQGQQVWPLIGNKFDPVLTGRVLADPKKRQKLVKALRDSLVKTNSDGINVDFENMNIKNKHDYVLFIKELKKALDPFGIVVSVDVSRESKDPNWSGSFDRRELGKIADFVIMMGYDEHWGGGSKAGSVASLPWVRDGIEQLMKEVPSQKIILGVPFYTREWVTDRATHKVESYDRAMPEAEKWIKEKKLRKIWDEKTSQYYVKYTAKGETHQLWTEDRQSMALRRDLVNEYHLRGIAVWRIGFESPDIWKALRSFR